MNDKSSPASRRPSRAASAPKEPPADFWNAKTLEQLMAEQGVAAVERLEEVLGQGAELWRDDAELDSFLAALRERRQKGA